MSARDDLLDEYGRAETAPLGTLAALKTKLDAIRTEAVSKDPSALRRLLGLLLAGWGQEQDDELSYSDGYFGEDADKAHERGATLERCGDDLRHVVEQGRMPDWYDEANTEEKNTRTPGAAFTPSFGLREAIGEAIAKAGGIGDSMPVIVLAQAGTLADAALTAVRQYMPPLYGLALPWARLLGAEDRAEFLEDLVVAAVRGRHQPDPYAAIEAALATWREVADPQHTTTPDPAPSVCFTVSHQGFPAGFYNNHEAAIEHVEALLAREEPDRARGRIVWSGPEADDNQRADVQVWDAFLKDPATGDLTTTSYMVTGIPLAPAYTPDADR